MQQRKSVVLEIILWKKAKYLGILYGCVAVKSANTSKHREKRITHNRWFSPLGRLLPATRYSIIYDHASFSRANVRKLTHLFEQYIQPTGCDTKGLLTAGDQMQNRPIWSQRCIKGVQVEPMMMFDKKHTTSNGIIGQFARCRGYLKNYVTGFYYCRSRDDNNRGCCEREFSLPLMLR